VGPFDRFVEYLAEGKRGLPCIWQSSCTNGFICVDPTGNAAQCDCWVASYPSYRFGNLLGPQTLAELLTHSHARQQLASRPGVLVRDEDCLDCLYLALCHGGCAVRAYTAYDTLFRKDPSCEVYKALFGAVADLVVGARSNGRSEPLSGLCLA
jgi:radical SAM protein with 4Fe4S-binding SPASM domain